MMMKLNWMEKYLTDAENMIIDDRVDEGLGLLNNLLYDEPGYGSLHNHLGWAYLYYTEDAARAELHLKMAVRFDETYAPPYLHLGALYIRQARYSDAIACSQAGLNKGNSNRVGLLQNLAQAYELRKDWRMAIKAYKEAMAVSVVDNEIHNLVAGIKRCRKKRAVLFFGL
jgi:tetratricopeptide (TPR) repeat protein